MHDILKLLHNLEVINMSLFFSSDYHFFHANVIKYCNRPFTSVEDMNETMIVNHNSKVSPNDTTYMLGDIAFVKNINDAIKVLNRMNGKKVLITGNHDSRNLKIQEFRNCFELISPLLEVKVDNQLIVLCHYSMNCWNKSHHKSFHLFGHSHGSMPDNPNSLSFDVGVDTNNFYPYSYNEVVQKMSTKKFISIDHHE